MVSLNGSSEQPVQPVVLAAITGQCTFLLLNKIADIHKISRRKLVVQYISVALELKDVAAMPSRSQTNPARFNMVLIHIRIKMDEDSINIIVEY